MRIHATEGTIIKIYPEEKGILKNGKPYRKFIFIFKEHEGVTMAVEFFNKCRQERMIKVNQKAYLEFYAQSRDFNGKWYTDIKCNGVRSIKEFTEHISNHADWM